jgi:hypothetical protein
MKKIEKNYHWEIRDETGVIHSGTEGQMDSAWDVLTAGSKAEYIRRFQQMDPELDRDDLEEIYDKWYTTWEGDIELLEVHAIYR